jgi:hypothetical protein
MSNFPAEAARLSHQTRKVWLSRMFKGTISRDWTESCSVYGKTLADAVHEMRDARILRFLMASSYLIQLINLAKCFRNRRICTKWPLAHPKLTCDWLQAVHYYYTVCNTFLCFSLTNVGKGFMVWETFVPLPFCQCHHIFKKHYFHRTFFMFYLVGRTLYIVEVYASTLSMVWSNLVKRSLKI